MNISSDDKEILKRATDKVLGANAILNFISDYFRDKYSIEPGGYITSDGEIVTPSEIGRTDSISQLLDMPGEVAMSESA